MTKEIILSSGEVVLVDDEDYPLLSRHKWQLSHADGYAVTTIQTRTGKNHTFFLHRFVMGGFWMCDHINRNKLDCRKENLRRATAQENSANMAKWKSRKGKPLSSKYKGVHKYTNNGKYRAVVCFNKKVIQLGTYDNEEDAARAYNKKAKELFGDFAWLNPVPQEAHQ